MVSHLVWNALAAGYDPVSAENVDSRPLAAGDKVLLEWKRKGQAVGSSALNFDLEYVVEVCEEIETGVYIGKFVRDRAISRSNNAPSFPKLGEFVQFTQNQVLAVE